MKKLNVLFAAIFLSAFMFSCNEDNEDLSMNTGTEGLDARLNINYLDSLTATVDTDNITDGQINVRLAIESDETVRRVYMTENEFGQGVEQADVKALLGQNIDTKGDGSIDVENGFNGEQIYFLNIDLADLPSASGTIVYDIWATKNKGDYRDPDKDRVESVATLTIELGTGQNSAAMLKSVSNVKLYPPDADLTTESFISTANGTVYGLDKFENSDFWDIGYNAQGDEPQLSSPFASPQRFPGNKTFQELITEKTGTPASELNKVYFKDIPDTFDFDGLSTAADFAGLDVDTDDSQTYDISTSVDGDLVAFLDQYGKKGVIRIDVLVDGNDNDDFFDSGFDYVQIDIKVQP